MRDPMGKPAKKHVTSTISICEPAVWPAYTLFLQVLIDIEYGYSITKKDAINQSCISLLTQLSVVWRSFCATSPSSSPPLCVRDHEQYRLPFLPWEKRFTDLYDYVAPRAGTLGRLSSTTIKTEGSLGPNPDSPNISVFKAPVRYVAVHRI